MRSPSGSGRTSTPPCLGHGSSPRRITIGFVNNMPDAALLSTERQFKRVLGAASGELDLDVKMLFLPDQPRGTDARAHLSRHYVPAHQLPDMGVDGLIVTGNTPREPSLADEPYWRNLTWLIDWAKDHTVSAIWSCLAAHAAALHLDGVQRASLETKVSGVFRCIPVCDHPLLAGLGSEVRIPHSRYNDLRESDLARNGYRILTRSDEIGADIFVKHWTSLFVFLQGHPEYDGDSLQREYRRDMTGFLRGQRETCPLLPSDYFDETATGVLSAFADQARASRDPKLLARFPDIKALPTLKAEWQHSATCFYRNWLTYVAEALGRGPSLPSRGRTLERQLAPSGQGGMPSHQRRRGHLIRGQT